MSTLEIGAAPPAPSRDASFRDAVRSMLPTAAGRPVRGGTNVVQVFVASHPVVQALLEEEAGPWASLVHVAQDVQLHRRLLPDEELTSRARVTGVRRVPGGGRVQLAATVDDADGRPLAELSATVLLSGSDVAERGGGPAGERAPRPAPAGPAWTAVLLPTLSSTTEYARVSGDDNPLHTDPAAAAAAGFDAPLAHGMSVVAAACELATDRFAGGDPGAVRGVGVRFSAPVPVGSPLTVSLHPSADPRFAGLSATTAAGTALKNGWVEFWPGGAR
ncbi:MaoC/PaaZ C-terminal domain-containing protein [Kineococcus sp. SYSU DK018]|uniref:MaoC/PaaZ C-terminal domain-containing protein n=1 Tax=Kineococcus sp. SYSU DK018 TaxID=3383139 RepID=UPI003D7E42A2